MLISAFEEEVFDLEGNRIVARVNRKQQVLSYNHLRKLGDEKTVESLLKRIKSCIVHLDVEIIRGDGTIVNNPGTTLGTIRDSYVKS